METPRLNSLVIFLAAFSAIMPTLMSEVLHSDAVWEKRAQKAKTYALKAYNPNPHNVTNALNHHAQRALDDAKAGRRVLSAKHRYTGPCVITNPIDRCWRCHADWSVDRKKLADCAVGFGHAATGGKDGRIYTVTDPSDDDVENPRPGTLRHAVIQKEPLWIIFARSMTIKLKQELIMQSDKTIDGRGAFVHIANGAGITIQYVKNIIIHNIHIHDIVDCNGGMIRDSLDHMGLRGVSDGDGINIFGSSNIWLDHLSMSNCKDGLIDVVKASTAITISNCHFTDHDHVILLGASDSYPEDQIMQVTLAFNHFGKRLIQRMPRTRFGFIHIVNNDYTHWQMYAIGGSSHPTIISQGNRYIANPDPSKPFSHQVTHRDYASEEEWKRWTWRSDGDVFMNGAYFVQSGDPTAVQKLMDLDHISPLPGTEVSNLTRFSGFLNCVVGKEC